MEAHVSRAQRYPFNKTHVQVLEGQVLSPEIYIGRCVATFANCEITGYGIRGGDRCWWARDLGLFTWKIRPTDEQVREVAREKLAELAGLGIYTPADRVVDGLVIPRGFFLPQ